MKDKSTMTRKPDRSRTQMIVMLCFVIFLSLLLPARATSIWYPKFGKPYICGSNIVFTSVNSDQVICMDFNGQIKWGKKYPKKVTLCQKDSNTLILQITNRVCSVDSITGQHKLLFEVDSEYDIVHFDFPNNIAYSTDRRFVERTFKWLDPDTGKVLWNNPEIESYLITVKTVVVCLHNHRIITDYTQQNGKMGHGFRYNSSELWGLDAKTGNIIWKIDIKDHRLSWVHFAYTPPYAVAVVDDGARLICFNPLDGHMATDTTFAAKDDFPNSIFYISSVSNQAVFMTCKRDYVTLKDGNYTLHFITAPIIKDIRTLNFSISEAASFEFYNNYIFTKSVYRSACFKAETGEKIWDKFQLNTSSPTSNLIAFSDYDQATKKTRIGLIDIPTGQETVLYRDDIPAIITLGN